MGGLDRWEVVGQARSHLMYTANFAAAWALPLLQSVSKSVKLRIDFEISWRTEDAVLNDRCGRQCLSESFRSYGIVRRR